MNTPQPGRDDIRTPNTGPGRPALLASTAAPHSLQTYTRIPQTAGAILLVPNKPEQLGEEVSTRQASRILGKSQRSIRRYCEEGRLQSRQLFAGTRRMITLASIQALLANSTDT